MSQKIILSCTCLLFLACSTSFATNDPLEGINRPIYYVNNVVDKTLLRPSVLAYDKIIPLPVKIGVSNFYRNMGQIPIFLNHVLQANPGNAGNTLSRFLINGTFGLLGIFDVATELGIPSTKQDFGQTFAKWGWKDSTYIVLPIMGPSTIRDSLSYIVSTLTSPQYYLLKKPTRNEYFAGYLIDKRLQLTNLESVVGNAGVDQYSFVRSSYLQNRYYTINDSTDNNLKNNSDSNNDGISGGPPE